VAAEMVGNVSGANEGKGRARVSSRPTARKGAAFKTSAGQAALATIAEWVVHIRPRG